uniref:Uncharacterized protein n=1 Tax=Helianthus annuus TaxID=4232 RepID=A0A251RSY8_HELAN
MTTRITRFLFSCECYKNRSLLHRVAHNLQFIHSQHPYIPSHSPFSVQNTLAGDTASLPEKTTGSTLHRRNFAGEPEDVPRSPHASVLDNISCSFTWIILHPCSYVLTRKRNAINVDLSRIQENKLGWL